jgi:hypothetical protein
MGATILRATYCLLCVRLTVMFSERPYLIAADANDGVRREPLRDAFWVETR